MTLHLDLRIALVLAGFALLVAAGVGAVFFPVTP